MGHMSASSAVRLPLLCCLLLVSCGRSRPEASGAPVVDASPSVCEGCDALAERPGADVSGLDPTATDSGASSGLDAIEDAIAADGHADTAQAPDGGSDSQPSDSGDVVADGQADAVKCKDWRKRGDNKVPSDTCWDPPKHYCSSPYEAVAVWFGCAPDFSICCAFGSLCRQCDWVVCPTPSPGDPFPSWAHPKCPKNWQAFYPPNQPATCSKYLPNYKSKFCWDGAPASWSLESTHAHDGM